MANHLYYGDNLKVLRDSIASESVDLIYLDPPFNSNASYNVLFKGPSGNASAPRTAPSCSRTFAGKRLSRSTTSTVRSALSTCGRLFSPLRGQLANGVLVSLDGDGHTAYRRGSQCVDDAVDAYYVRGVVPEDGLAC